MSYAAGSSGGGGGRRIVRKYRTHRKQAGRFDEIAATTPPPASDPRDWGHLPDLVISDVLRRVVPCLRSLSAFAATCRPWRRFFLASASTLLQRIPPLILQAKGKSTHLTGLSPAVISKPVKLPQPGIRSTLISSSRGHLVLLDKPRHILHVVDALTGAERLAIPLPPSISPYHYASLTQTHLILFVHKHALVSIPFPTPNPTPEWTRHDLPPAVSSVTAVIEFRGRVLGITNRAELLEFRLDDVDTTTVQLLHTTALPDSAEFERWEFGPRLIVAGERLLLLLLIMADPRRGSTTQQADVRKVSLHALDEAAMRWEELDDIGDYSLFVDCPGRSAVACLADAGGGCGVMPNRVYFLVSRSYYCFEHVGPDFMAFPPGPHGHGEPQPQGWDSPWHKLISLDRDWPPSQTWVYPRLFYRC